MKPFTRFPADGPSQDAPAGGLAGKPATAYRDTRPDNRSTGPRGYPLVGHIPAFLRDRLGFLSDCAARYGDVVRLRIGRPTLLLNNPDDIRHVLIANGSNYEKTPRLTSARGRRLSGSGLLTGTGAAAQRQRKLLRPVFSRKTIDSLAASFVRNTQALLERWPDRGELDVAPPMMALAQNNILDAVLGASIDDRDRLARDLTIRRRYMEQFFFSPFPAWWPNRVGLAYRSAILRIDAMLDGAIQQRRRNDQSADDLLSLLVAAKHDDGAGMTDAQVRDEARTLLITGYETNGEALAWTLHLLAKHSEIEARLHAEVGALCGRRPPSVDDVPKLRYTAAVLAESMRLFPPTWIIVRIAVADDMLPSGAPVAAASKIYLCPYVTHRDPRYWSDPDRFDPDRFGDAAPSRPALAYFPFSAGARVCLGESLARMESVLVLATITQSFAVTDAGGHGIELEPRMTLRSKSGVRVQLGRRH